MVLRTLKSELENVQKNCCKTLVFKGEKNVR